MKAATTRGNPAQSESNERNPNTGLRILFDWNGALLDSILALHQMRGSLSLQGTTEYLVHNTAHSSSLIL
jgi:hypothetical protein